MQRRNLGRDRGQDERLDQTVVGAERVAWRQRACLVVAELVLAEQQGPELVVVELLGVAEPALHLGGDGLVALDDEVEDVADRDDVGDSEVVALVDQELLHHLQRGAVALHRRGEGAQRRDQRRRERIGTPERSLVGAALSALGADAVEQHVPHRWRAVDARRRPRRGSPSPRSETGFSSRFSATYGRLSSPRTMVRKRPSW